MKKIYSNPDMKVVKIMMRQMLAASPDGFASGLNDTRVNGNAALGRKGGFLDDEDVEE